MLIREKAEFLRQYDIYEEEAERIRLEVDFWSERIKRCEKRKDAACAKKQMEYYTRLLITKYQFCLAARMVVEEAITSCKHPRNRLLLRRRFVDRLSIEEVAELMKLSVRHVMRIYREALEDMQMVAPDAAGCQASMERAMAWLTLPRNVA